MSTIQKPQITATTVQALLSDKSRWTKGSLAKTKSGKAVLTSSTEACKFCLSGAVNRIYKGMERRHVTRKLRQVIKGYTLSTDSDIINFNDHSSTKFKDIQRVIAIAGI